MQYLSKIQKSTARRPAPPHNRVVFDSQPVVKWAELFPKIDIPDLHLLIASFSSLRPGGLGAVYLMVQMLKFIIFLNLLVIWSIDYLLCLSFIWAKSPAGVKMDFANTNLALKCHGSGCHKRSMANVTLHESKKTGAEVFLHRRIPVSACLHVIQKD